MTVAELIEKLQAMPQDALVLVMDDELSTLHPPEMAHSELRRAVIIATADGNGPRLLDTEYADLFMA